MKLIENIFRAATSPNLNYKYYGKHRVNFQGECEHQKRINEVKKKSLKEYQDRVGL